MHTIKGDMHTDTFASTGNVDGSCDRFAEGNQLWNRLFNNSTQHASCKYTCVQGLYTPDVGNRLLTCKIMLCMKIITAI